MGQVSQILALDTGEPTCYHSLQRMECAMLACCNSLYYVEYYRPTEG
jgi:hypothetical protein